MWISQRAEKQQHAVGINGLTSEQRRKSSGPPMSVTFMAKNADRLSKSSKPVLLSAGKAMQL